MGVSFRSPTAGPGQGVLKAKEGELDVEFQAGC